MPDGRFPTATAGRDVWLQVGWLIDGLGGPPVRDAHVVYDATAIRYVGPCDLPPPPDVRGPRTAPDLILQDVTLLPGLIECHAHLFLAGAELDPTRRGATWRQAREAGLGAARERAERLVRLGIAAVRDAGDRLGVGVALGRLSRDPGGPVLPTVESPGAAIHHRGRYGAFMAEAVEDHASPDACVRARVRGGADRIKLIATGVVDFASGRMTGPPQMTAAEVAAFVAAARELGRPTFAHASGADGIRHVIDGRVGSVEHGLLMDPDDLARMRDREIAWTPTFAPVAWQLAHAQRLRSEPKTVAHLRNILEHHAERLRTAHALGVTILAGSDAGSPGVPHGYGLLDELELLERAGLPPAAVLHAATAAPAACLGLRDRCGRIAPGYRSRFILTRHSPLERIGNLRRARQVVFDGTAYDSPETEDTVGL